MGSHISQINSELQEIQSLVAKIEGSKIMPQIEIDLALSKLQKVYDLLLHESNILKSKHPDKVQTEENTKTVLKNSIKDEKAIENHELENIDKKVKTTDELIFIEEKKGEIHSTSELENKNLENHEHKAHNHPEHEQHKTKEIIAEKYSKNQQLINEKLAHHKKDISGKLQSKALKNIEEAIGVNEKFLFVRELFNGDAETFLKTIRILNNASNFNEAFNYIHSTFDWNLENEAAQKLLDLVRRRYITDEE
jgi:hypothetical protein